ncbi:Uncharacterised protein [Mycobacteroides abscessus subsp. abscessus]|nr:Uncharacterised protein [Mycobacteroides abscessus subsp. abscessus]
MPAPNNRISFQHLKRIYLRYLKFHARQEHARVEIFICDA